MDATGKKISIITPSFNQAGYLEQTIQSVIGQNYSNLEYIIIDGGSSDNSPEIIKKYERHIAYWVSETDTGQSHAINKGLEKATGDIIAWINSDDQYLPGALKTVSNYFSRNPEIDLIYGNAVNLYPNGKTKNYIVKEFDPVDLLSRVSVHQPSVFWKRGIHEEIGVLDETLNYVMDYDLWLRIFFRYKTKRVDKMLSIFRIHADSKTYYDPRELYYEKRKVISRFFNSLHDKTWKNQLISLGLYDNNENIKYIFHPEIQNANDFSRKIFLQYVYNCGIEEYTFGNYNKAQYFFRKSLIFMFFKSIFFMVKNFIKNQCFR